MTATTRAPAAVWRATLRAARRVADVVAECNYAQRRLFELRLDPERYALDADRAPDTYSEFLFRTFGPPWLEPAAGERAKGARVRPVASRDASKRQARR
jgi:hypothetical protein